MTRALLLVGLLAACTGPHVAAPDRPDLARELRSRALPEVPGACIAQADQPDPRHGRIRRVWFPTPCPAALTPTLVGDLQRALAARGLYHGPATGRPDAATAEAVRRFQAPLGLDSPVLSLAAARHLGLVPVEPAGI